MKNLTESEAEERMTNIPKFESKWSRDSLHRLWQHPLLMPILYIPLLSNESADNNVGLTMTLTVEYCSLQQAAGLVEATYTYINLFTTHVHFLCFLWLRFPHNYLTSFTPSAHEWLFTSHNYGIIKNKFNKRYFNFNAGKFFFRPESFCSFLG